MDVGCITDATGNQIAHYEYTPYGSLAVNELANGQTSQPVNHYFTGKELDSTGLYFYGARYYDPEIGRFISADTIVQEPFNPQTLNRYSYCGNNPINYVDPDGHWFWAVIAIIAKIAAAVSITTAVAGGISYAAGNESAAKTLFQVSQYSGYLSMAASAACFVNSAMIASRSQMVSLDNILTAFDDPPPNVQLGRIVVKLNPREVGINPFAVAWETTKDVVGVGIAGTVSAVGSQLAQTGAWASGLVNSAAYAGAEYIVDKMDNGFSICPRYGNWGGRDWSGTQQIRAGQIGFSSVPAVDQMDGYFKQHDFNVYNALKVSAPTTRNALKLDANRMLYGQLNSLPEDSSKWSPSAKDPEQARTYRKKAELWFNPKNPFQ